MAAVKIVRMLSTISMSAEALLWIAASRISNVGASLARMECTLENWAGMVASDGQTTMEWPAPTGGPWIDRGPQCEPRPGTSLAHWQHNSTLTHLV